MIDSNQTLGEDPFRRSPVVALLPCVRLDNNHNLKLFQATLCEVGTCPRSRWQDSIRKALHVASCSDTYACASGQSVTLNSNYSVATYDMQRAASSNKHCAGNAA